MALFSFQSALYLVQVAGNVDNFPTYEAEHQFTLDCPDCNTTVDPSTSGVHTVLDRGDKPALIVMTCEGRWMVNPYRVGVPVDGWTPADGSGFWNGTGVDPYTP